MAETVDDASASSVEGEEPVREDAPSVTELLLLLGRDVSVLVLCETQLAASRSLPEIRRAARAIIGVVVAMLAFLTAFVFANVAGLSALTAEMSSWLAALVLCVAWLVLGCVVVLALTSAPGMSPAGGGGVSSAPGRRRASRARRLSARP